MAVSALVWHAVLFAAATVASAIITAWATRHRDKHAADQFILFAGVLTVWNLSLLAEIAAPTPELTLVVAHVERFFTVLITLTWFYFAASYAGYRDLLVTRPGNGLVLTGAAVMTLLNSVPPFDTLTHVDARALSDPFVIVAFTDTTVGTIVEVLGLLFVLIGTFALVYRLVTAGYTRTWQSVIVVGSVLLTVIFEFFEDALFSPVPGVEYTNFLVTGVAAAYILALYRYDVFGHKPVSRRDVIESVADPVFVVNPDDEVVDHNHAATDFVGRAIPPGTPVAEVLPPELRGVDIIEDMEDGYAQVTLDDGVEVHHYNVHVAELESLDASGAAIALRDVTELQKRQRDLEHQTEQLEEFASIVSHDIRNPLTVAQTYLSELDRDIDRGELDTALESLERMDEMIEDAVTMARKGQMIEEKEWREFADLARSAWVTSATGDAELEVAVPDDAVVHADPSRLATVLENLYRNSVDHGSEDTTVRVGLIGDSNDTRGFYVEDDGPGIPTEERDRVFDEGFTTLEEGTGFGLAIVGAIAAAHNWRVDVSESPDGGARFEFYGVVAREEPSADAADGRDRATS